METLIITPKSKKDLLFLKELLKNLSNVAAVKVGKEEKPVGTTVKKAASTKTGVSKASTPKATGLTKPITAAAPKAKVKTVQAGVVEKSKADKKSGKKKGKKNK